MLRCSPGRRFAAARSCAPHGRSRPDPEEGRSAPAGMALPCAARSLLGGMVDGKVAACLHFRVFFFLFRDESFLLMKQLVRFLTSIVFCLPLKEALLSFYTWAF